MILRQKIIEEMYISRLDKGLFYDYSDLTDVSSFDDKICVNCLKHGQFTQILYKHLCCNRGCPKCSKEQFKHHKGRTKEYFIENLKNVRTDKGEFYDYSLVSDFIKTNKEKIMLICPVHGQFTQIVQDHEKNTGCRQCGIKAREERMLRMMGVSSVMHRPDIIKKRTEHFEQKYGVDNISKLDHIKKKKELTYFENYGANNYFQSEVGKNHIKQILRERYNVDNPSQIPDFRDKMYNTKLKNGTLGTFNTSNEATQYIRQYIKEKNYSLDQVAFSDPENSLHEWGNKIGDKWILYDLTVFEEGHRGDKEHIIEILEYHGPFHYTQDDVETRGNDYATPWESNTMTIKESYDLDMLKYNYAKTLTDNVIVIWSDKYHKDQTI